MVHVVATPAAMNWIDAQRVEQATGFPVLTEQRQPRQTKRLPPPTQVIVCPATFNTVNKKPFQETLKNAGFYAEWRGKFGEDAWKTLERYSGALS